MPYKFSYDRKSSSLPLEKGEDSPLMMRHISMGKGDDDEEAQEHHHHGWSSSKFSLLWPWPIWKRFFLSPSPQRMATILVVLLVFGFCLWSSRRHWVEVIPIEKAVEYTIDVGDGKQVWFRTWGSASSACFARQHEGEERRSDQCSSSSSSVPAILFVHGGPGQAVVDYRDGNKRFFDANELLVVEVDQRGTGNSQPSVRDDYRNMKLYHDVSIDEIATDFEEVRKYLGIDTWVVWGGSFGSTIALNYCMVYPESCIALLLRGIYLDTADELEQVYSQRAHEDDDRKSAEFDVLYRVAQEEVDRQRRHAEKKEKVEPLDPNDYKRLMQVYESMIDRGDRQAIWAWHTFENNLMEDDPSFHQDPNIIIESKFPEAQSVAFFETRLWLHGTFEHPSNLLQKVERLDGIPIWICQGIHDNVCPVQNAWKLVMALKDAHHQHNEDDSDAAALLQAYFVDANHEDTDPVMETCLKKIMREFLDMNSQTTK